jgi:hypothetical protein
VRLKDNPIILNSVDDHGERLTRIESQTKDEKSEEWLQRLIYQHPCLLPVSFFDESFSPLISVGREIQTPSGYIDNLYVSPVGRLTLVETKLWKNSEKHRTVVAQLIDYAKEVSEWSYDYLNNAVLKASRESQSDEKKSLDQIVEPHLKEVGLSLTEFQERVIGNLNNGEFLLLVVGERISSNVALLAEAIHGAPGLDFRLGLIELHLYPLNGEGDWPLLVVPDVVGRTVEKTRGVIKIQYVKEKPKTTVEISPEEKKGQPKGRTTPEIFLQKTPDDLRPVYEQWLKIWKDKKFHICWGTTGFSVRTPVQGKLQTIFDAYPEWAASLVRESDAEKCNISNEDYQKYINAIKDVSNAADVLAHGKRYLLNENLTAEDLMSILEATTDLAEKTKDS